MNCVCKPFTQEELRFIPGPFPRCIVMAVNYLVLAAVALGVAVVAGLIWKGRRRIDPWL